jgi:excisionase family DNA binding protein
MKMTIKDNDKLLTPAEVALMLRVSKPTIVKWSEKGDLPFIQLPSGVRRFIKKNIFLYLEGKYVTR